MPDIPDRFIDMYRRQEQLQMGSFIAGGRHPREMNFSELMEYLRVNFLAIFNEINEAMNETGWKPWATEDSINVEAFRGELVDAFHFMLNLLIAAGIQPHEFYTAFLEKNDRNARRQLEGYDGKTGKCPTCKRSYDDSGVSCNPGHCATKCGAATAYGPCMLSVGHPVGPMYPGENGHMGASHPAISIGSRVA
jgi:hypothetical protein